MALEARHEAESERSGGRSSASAPSPAELFERTRPLGERINELLEEPCDSLAAEVDVLTKAYGILNAELR
ncbi:hypothetical protein [Corynebacterium pyruviciproducens]|uniref:Uncharacterized protein n=1 Tax=Corynebacterium pyruviciproducens TaxID=598660 RepID=A0AAF1BXH0_9CORY|nr:hypothetical protein [Corynebacterium pyruviciproducens]MDK6566621.1 hypothetical protein [Corynebacterium pyruviciproducens]MDK7214953.1 hypothetical protein [Corynebacterium pyruviciproducens]WOT03442.1 hypothetical protein CYJ47_06750 [Corynebacterium pyruviciproducens]